MQESLEASLVRIRTADGRVVGAGFLVGERHILTCAHVISQALGLPDHPLDPPQGLVSLDFPLIPPRTLLTASVIQWSPPLSDGRGDIAGLELQCDPPAGAEVVRFAPAEDVWEHSFRAFGFPAGYDDGVWATGRLLGRQATDWVMIEDVKTQGFAVAPGFSGTPVWDTRLQGVVGMVVAASRSTDLKAAFVLPLDVLMAAWRLIEPVTRQRVFLSAAPADADFAARLTTDLEALDIVVWTEQYTPDDEHADKEERVRQAIATANSGTTTMITFNPSLQGSISLSSDDLIIAKNLFIRGPGANLLSITGGHNSHQVHVVAGVSVIISDLTIASFDSSGIKNFGNLTLINSAVSHNKTDGDGGGIENFATGTLTLMNSIVSDNFAESNDPTFIANSVFEDGGGIYNHGRLALINSIVSGNTAAKYGGGIVNGRGTATATITNSTILDNAACQAGGGIYNGAHDGMVTLTLSNSTVSYNTVGFCLQATSIPAKDTAPGGGIYNTSLATRLTITNSAISDNTTFNGPGGGIYNQGPLTLTNSTVSGNKSSFVGGGIAISNGQANLTFCTIYGNLAIRSGGGITISMSRGTTPTFLEMSNSIVAGNHAGTGLDISGTLTSEGYNLIQDTSGATFTPNKQHLTDVSAGLHIDLGIDPILRDNGGSTEPHTLTLALLPGSPAINAISLAACHPNGITTDQRGVKRPDENESACDIGAYESSP